MSLGDLFWFFFIFMAVQPMIRQRWLEARRLRLLTQLERQRRSRVIALVHRQETMSFLGFPLFRYIDIQDSEEILRAIKLTGGDVPIDLVVHTPGGLVLAEKALRQVRQCVTWILEERVGRDRAAALAETLSQGTWTHDYPITFEEAKEMGLPVSPAIPDEIHQLMALFPQPARQRPSVEYVPLPYRTRPGGPSRGATSP